FRLQRGGHRSAAWKGTVDVPSSACGQRHADGGRQGAADRLSEAGWGADLRQTVVSLYQQYEPRGKPATSSAVGGPGEGDRPELGPFSQSGDTVLPGSGLRDRGSR